MASHDDDRAGRVTRRGALISTTQLLGLAAAAWVAGRTGTAEAQSKMSQKTAKYQASPKDGKACAACTHFEPPNACHLVAGTISLNGWCQYFAPKLKS
jgi:hypothetical protein